MQPVSPKTAVVSLLALLVVASALVASVTVVRRNAERGGDASAIVIPELDGSHGDLKVKLNLSASVLTEYGGRNVGTWRDGRDIIMFNAKSMDDGVPEVPRDKHVLIDTPGVQGDGADALNFYTVFGDPSSYHEVRYWLYEYTSDFREVADGFVDVGRFAFSGEELENSGDKYGYLNTEDMMLLPERRYYLSVDEVTSAGKHFPMMFADGDGDLSSDIFELHVGTDPDNLDTDEDGLKDGEEALISAASRGALQLNPLSADSDGDGTGDADEVAEFETSCSVSLYGDGTCRFTCKEREIDARNPLVDPNDVDYQCIFGYTCCVGQGDQSGACCFSDETCQIQTQNDCSAMEGYIWMGAGSLCAADDTCPPTRGACCDDTTGACTPDLYPDFCFGTFVGYGTSCDPNPCSEGGACCGLSGECFDTLEGPCTSGVVWPGGLWQEGTICNPDGDPNTDDNPCPQPGACCNTDGTCSDDQAEQGCIGNFMGEDITCSEPPEILCGGVGACCVAGACWETYEAECGSGDDEHESGVFQGAGTTCQNVSCPGSGACCYLNGMCTDGMSEGTCDITVGFFQGAGSTCSDTSCAYGACCNSDTNECNMRFETACTSDGNYWLSGMMCSDNPCVEGACCRENDGECVEATRWGPSGCETYGYTWVGDTECTVDTCDFLKGACCRESDGECEMAFREGPSGCETHGHTWNGGVCDSSPCSSSSSSSTSSSDPCANCHGGRCDGIQQPDHEGCDCPDFYGEPHRIDCLGEDPVHPFRQFLCCDTEICEETELGACSPCDDNASRCDGPEHCMCPGCDGEEYPCAGGKVCSDGKCVSQDVDTEIE